MQVAGSHLFFLKKIFFRILCIRFVSYPLLSTSIMSLYTQTLFSLHLFSSTILHVFLFNLCWLYFSIKFV